MADYKWCHGPSCHKSRTQDRIRGSKGSKVLRTRKIKDNPHYNQYYTPFKYFCSQGCYTDFFKEHIERIIAIAPRHEPLETPIDDPVRTKHDTGYGTSYYSTVIKERVDTSMEQDYKGYRKDIYMETVTEKTEVRKNRFTGESIKLTKEEAEKYDAIINNEYAANMEDNDRNDVGISSFWDLVRRDLDWFRKNNAKAYMVLLD